MFSTETVTVLRPTVAYDERMDPVTDWEAEELSGVLFDSPTTEDVEESMRAFGVRAAYRMHVPKSYTASLRGCLVRRADGSVWQVAGDPMPLASSPLPWDRSATLGWSDG